MRLRVTNMKRRHWIGALGVSLLLGLAAWINLPLITRGLRVCPPPLPSSPVSGF